MRGGGCVKSVNKLSKPNKQINILKNTQTQQTQSSKYKKFREINFTKLGSMKWYNDFFSFKKTSMRILESTNFLYLRVHAPRTRYCCCFRVKSFDLRFSSVGCKKELS